MDKDIAKVFSLFLDEVPAAVQTLDTSHGEEDFRESATTHLSEEELRVWKKGSMFERLKMIMKAFEELIELDEMHEHHDGIQRMYIG